MIFPLMSCEDSREEKAIAAAKRLSVNESSKPKFRNVIFIQTPSDDKNPDTLKGNVCGEVKFNDPTGRIQISPVFLLRFQPMKTAKEV